MRITATQLRADIYRLLDHVLETGEALHVERGGRVIRIVPAEASRLEDLFPPQPELIVGDAGELAELDWSDSWTGELPTVGAE